LKEKRLLLAIVMCFSTLSHCEPSVPIDQSQQSADSLWKLLAALTPDSVPKRNPYRTEPWPKCGPEAREFHPQKTRFSWMQTNKVNQSYELV